MKQEPCYDPSWLNRLPEAYGYHQVITNHEGEVVDAVFLYVNLAFEDMIGLKSEEILGKSVTEVLPHLKTGDGDWMAFLGKAVLKREKCQIQQYFKALDRWYHITAHSHESGYCAVLFHDITRIQKQKNLLVTGPVVQNTGDPNKIEKVPEVSPNTKENLGDISEEMKEAEAHVSERQRELDQYFETSLDLLCIANTKGEFIRLNPEWGRVLGYSTEALEGKPFLDFVHPEDIESTLEAVQDLVNQQEVVKFVNRYRCRDGSYRWIEWRSRCQGQRIYAVARDISERIEYQRALKEYKERLSQAQTFANAGTWEYDIEKATLDWSSECEALFGIETGSFGGTFEAFLRYVHPEDRDEVMAQNQFILHKKEEKNLKYEHRILKPSGQVRWVQEIAGVHRDKEGKPVKVTGFVMDITDRKESENALKEREKLLELFFNQSLHGFYFCMLEEPIEWNEHSHQASILEYALNHQRMTRVNQGMLDQYGAQEDHFKGLTLGQLFQHDLDQAREITRRLFNNGQCHIETREQKLDGSPLMIDGEYTCLYDDQGRITGHIGVQVDITEKKKAQQQIKDNERRLNTLLSNTPAVIYSYQIDQQGIPKITYINENVKEVLGYHPKELTESIDLWKACVHPEDLPDLGEKLTGRTGTNQYRFKDKKGNYHWLLDTQRAIDRGEEEWEVMGTWWDITDRIRAEEKLQEYARLLEKKNLEWEEATKEAQVASKAKTQFLANMSHEIRTPMNGILGFLQLLEETTTDEQQSQYIKYIKISTDTLLTLINDILDLSKIESGKMALEEIPFDLHSLLEEAMISQSYPAQSKQIPLKLQIHEGLPAYVQGDPIRFKQILTNLLSNAVKFTEAGSIMLECRSLEEKQSRVLVEIRVTDTGIGIDSEAQKTLFEAFTQADNSTTREFGGTGLGLTIVKDLVTLMGGYIGIQSTPGQGSTFTLRIPLALHPEKPIHLHEAEPKQEILGELLSQGVSTVLIVEDQEINQALIQQLLNNRGIHCDIAQNGKEAVEACGKKPYDLVLMDIQMPVMNGLEATRQIRKLKIHPQPKIVAMTAHAMGEDKIKCMEAGMDDYLTKPIRFDQVKEVLKKKRKQGEVLPKTQWTEVIRYLKEEIGFDQQAAETLLRQALEEWTERLMDIKTFLEKEDRESFKQALHGLKGAAANLRVREVADLAQKGEQQMALGEIKALKETLRRIQWVLEGFSDEMPPAIHTRKDVSHKDHQDTP